jgi:hypothetical protein
LTFALSIFVKPSIITVTVYSPDIFDKIALAIDSDVKGVPALVCDQCGEAYTDQQVTRRLLQIANEEAQKGPREEFIQYVA